MNPPATGCLVLRLAGPVQSWGGTSMFNRRETLAEPTKSGLVGLLAAAQGRRRTDPIEDLLDLTFGVRTDQPGTLLRDYHTVSDYRGVPLPSASVSVKGTQKSTSPAKYTHVTERFYLQDAVFVVAVAAPDPVLATLAEALRNPAFPLALGRRACPPTQPLLFTSAGQPDATVWTGTLLEVLEQVPWQAGKAHRDKLQRQRPRPRRIGLPVTLDDLDGEDVRMDLPSTFDPRHRSFTARRVRQTWVHLAPPYETAEGDADSPPDHDPFALLGW
ncbi:CRISPR-associated Cas5e family protein [Candidatus Protofrankia californiensis]|uniref:CRISPR-associated Cas5e family protein n=1 Tax=Candidatus Protofrankia californiensis TaxID=1839754 RepID=A0A1C3NZC0_9ACTN|nr:CRISPR-associated Cas5e family protein [Candidatus Protofrankia californiensis]